MKKLEGNKDYKGNILSKVTTLGISSLISLVLISNNNALAQSLNNSTETIKINVQAKTQKFPHFWEKIFGSGRAILSLRESYRKDMKMVKDVTDMAYVRPHAIFHDEVGFYDEDAKGNAIYNFSYIDQIYDGILESGVKPFVELSFMPRKMALKLTEHPFWYKQITAPPKDWNKWEEMIYQFTNHLVNRYGIKEVEKWYFEVWNEPNIDFWSGDPKESTYYELYDRAAKAVKRVNTKLRIGGPSTAQAAWIDKFIKHCVDNKIPVDFVTTHVYANDSAKDVFGTDEFIPRKNMVARSVKKVYDLVKKSAKPNLPIIWSEYNASYKNEVPVTDSPFMGPWIANNIRQCDGMTDYMSYWDFSDVFEEFGVVKKPFYGGFGLVAAGNIPKASYNAFKLLHQLGTERIISNSESVLVTKKPNGSIVIALWNYAEPEEKGINKKVNLVFSGNTKLSKVKVQTLDRQNGSSLTTWEKIGSPAFPSIEQQKQLRKSAILAAPKMMSLKNNSLNFNIAPHTLMLIELNNK